MADRRQPTYGEVFTAAWILVLGVCFAILLAAVVWAMIDESNEYTPSPWKIGWQQVKVGDVTMTCFHYSRVGEEGTREIQPLSCEWLPPENGEFDPSPKRS